MRMPWPGPSGETDLFARPSAISFADLLNSPGAGFVESVFTFADHRRDGGVVDRFPDFAAWLRFADERVEDPELRFAEGFV
jgi:hypothetical protein